MKCAHCNNEIAESSAYCIHCGPPTSPQKHEASQAPVTAGSRKGKFATSWRLIKESWRVLMADKELLWFPVISAIAMMIIVVSFVIPLFAVPGFSGSLDRITDMADSYVLYLGLFAFYLVTYSVANFFNAALIGAAYIRLNGGNPTLADGLKQATQRIGKIFLWSAVAATVGTILRVVEERSNTLGKIVAAIVGVAWSLLTYFAVPVIVFENLSLWPSIKRSGSLFKKTWGENVISQISFGLIFMLLGLLGIFIPVIVALSGIEQLLIPTVILMVVYWVLLGVISSTLVAIFDTALYIYATTGVVPVAFSAELLQNAFAPKKGWLR